MTSIQKQAAELLNEWDHRIDFDGSQTRETGEQMAALLRQIASTGGDLEPVARVIYRIPLADIRLFGASVVRGFDEFPVGSHPEHWREGELLYTQQALDAARLAGFEAGRRKGLEDAADLCELDGALYTGFDMAASVRELINKEA